MNYWIVGFTSLTFLIGMIMCGATVGIGISFAIDPNALTADYSLAEMLLVTIISFLFGIGFMALSGFSMWRTSFGRRFKFLSPIDRIITIIAMLPGVIAACSMSFGLIVIILPIIFFLNYAEEAMKRESRIKEIEEGVRRGMRR
jgi:hypothetical protein